MRDVDIPPDESVDPPASWVSPEFEWWDRSRCRTPMPWSGDPGAGFSTGRPWLRLGPDAATRNVAAQRADPDSVFALYRRLIALRAASPALQVGDLRLEPEAVGDVVAYSRTTGDQTMVVVVNLGRAATTWRLAEPGGRAGWRLVLRTGGPPEADTVLDGGAPIELEPDAAMILLAT